VILAIKKLAHREKSPLSLLLIGGFRGYKIGGFILLIYIRYIILLLKEENPPDIHTIYYFATKGGL
jgi:hypothetical protein